MATISNTPRPGYVWDSTDNVWYPIGVGGHGHTDYITQATAVNPTLIDAKGDIITATAADTPARLAVGNNGESIVADSAATTGLRYSATPSASNPVINSAMQVWQRGTSIALGAGTYTADRWYGYRGVAGSTVTRQATGDTTNLPNIQYSLRVQRDSGNTSTTAIAISNSFESINSIPFAGKPVTLSFYARAGVNFSQASSTLSFTLSSGTGTDQNVMTGYTGQATVATTAAVLTTTWQRFTVSGTVASTATELGIKIGDFNPVGTAGANDWFEVTGVQIDVGSVALPFRTYAATIQGELAACQRYFLKYGGNQVYETFPGVLLSYSTTQGEGPIAFKSTMRTTPTVAFSTLKVSDVATFNVAVTNITITTNTSGPDAAYLVFTVASGVTSGKTILLRTDGSTAGYLTFSAEL